MKLTPVPKNTTSTSPTVVTTHSALEDEDLLARVEDSALNSAATKRRRKTKKKKKTAKSSKRTGNTEDATVSTSKVYTGNRSSTARSVAKAKVKKARDSMIIPDGPENAVSEGLLVTDYLAAVDYERDPSYVPSNFSVKFVNFIKLVNAPNGEASPTPVAHYKMLDLLAGKKVKLANLCCRGSAKTSIFAEYLFLYIATFGEIEGFGEIFGAIYVADTIENGVKSLRKNIEYRYHNSEFLQTYIPQAKFTDVYMEFTNAEGHKFAVKSFGSSTGLRGTKIFGKRPPLAVLDDLVSDDDARSATVMESIKDTVYKGVEYALDPTRRKIVFSGTPFNKNDILYEAVESGAWHVNVFPVCEQFPCRREDFRSMWPERFSYDYVWEQYMTAKATGQLAAFNQEMMLRIISEEDLLVPPDAIQWYSREILLANREYYNFYITTDFATGAKESNDFSVISVWAYNSNGDWFFVDGICVKQTMDNNIDDLFRLVGTYKPLSVGIEVSGQQGGFISWIQSEQIKRNTFFTLAKEKNSNTPGFRPSTNKMIRFETVLPLILTNKIFLPTELKNTAWVIEAEEELSLVSKKGMKSKHDDVLDTFSMLTLMRPWKPSEAVPKNLLTMAGRAAAAAVITHTGDMWDDDDDEENYYGSDMENSYLC